MRFALYDVNSGLLHPWEIRIQKLPIFPYFYPQNSPKMGVNRRFLAKHAKYSNFCIFKMTNAIATKFCTVIKTIKFSLWVIQKFAPQVQYGGQPPSWEWINFYISATVWPISTKFCMLMHIGPKNPTKCSIDPFLKNPRWRTAAILKNVKCDISATVWPILVKIGMVMHFSPPKLMEN